MSNWGEPPAHTLLHSASMASMASLASTPGTPATRSMHAPPAAPLAAPADASAAAAGSAGTDVSGFIYCPPGWDEQRLLSGPEAEAISKIALDTFTDIAFIREKNAIQITGETHDDVYKAQSQLNSIFFPVVVKSKKQWVRPDRPGNWGQRRDSPSVVGSNSNGDGLRRMRSEPAFQRGPGMMPQQHQQPPNMTGYATPAGSGFGGGNNGNDNMPIGGMAGAGGFSNQGSFNTYGGNTNYAAPDQRMSNGFNGYPGSNMNSMGGGNGNRTSFQSAASSTSRQSANYSNGFGNRNSGTGSNYNNTYNSNQPGPAYNGGNNNYSNYNNNNTTTNNGPAGGRASFTNGNNGSNLMGASANPNHRMSTGIPSAQWR
ncbi:hypothetical protein BC831DRAFT_547418 [Entophlyctis helioformis]|nr:hypothetical protein BC831DRAFT_547418 [Entophlyctis helioformis]